MNYFEQIEKSRADQLRWARGIYTEEETRQMELQRYYEDCARYGPEEAQRRRHDRHSVGKLIA